MLRQAGIAALISLFMGLVPLGFGIRYAIQPTEQRLALMRPLSLAAIFAAIHGTALGLLSFFRGLALSDTLTLSRAGLVGLSESMVPLFFDFGCLMLAWICVAIGQWRRP
jgi:hypothetical protein